MCFYVEKNHPEPIIAEEDIICWKILTKEYKSPYQSFEYNQGKPTDKVSIKPIVYSVSSSRLIGIIHEGYHSFSNKEYAWAYKSVMHDMREYLEIFEATIPKGTFYYTSPVSNEYVSEVLIVH